MNTALRLVCLLGALAVFLMIVTRVRRSKIRIQDSVFWVAFAAILLLIAIFPGIAYAISDLLGFVSPSNFVFLVVIGVLIVREFHTSQEISTLRGKLDRLAQDIALRERDGR